MAPQREWFEKDYYKVLGVSNTATEKEITRAYRKLAKAHHPDASPGSEERFKEISAAYDVLGDPPKRKEYDEVRRLGPMAGAGGPGGFTFQVDDLSDLLGGLFGRGGRGGGRGGPQRGRDLEAELHLSFVDAVNGVTTTVNLTSDAPCHVCGGSGAAPGTSPVTCPRCQGRGVVADNQGPFSFSQPCPRCAGRGQIIETPCRECRGSGVVARARQVKVRIPPGVQDGQRIRLKGRGAAGHNNGPPGDLFVRAHVARHPLFGRDGANLTLDVPVTFPEAALGATITVPTLDQPVNVRIPAGTASGKTFRVRGRGGPRARGGGHGDLMVTVEVAVPKKLSGKQKEALEALASVAGESPRTHMGVAT